MGYTDIVKKAWRVTWRYRALWVLGIFAGITGGGAGGGSGGGGGRSAYSPRSSSAPWRSMSGMDAARFGALMARLIPVIVVAVIGLTIIAILWWVLRIAATGGLVHAVNEIESGRPFTLGAAWNAGFARFWSLLGLGILLGLPVLLLGMALAASVFIPLIPALLHRTPPGPAAIAPICGSLAIGLPLLIVTALVLGITHILGTRFVMLYGLGAFAAAKESWRAFRQRFKDTALMYLLSWALNIVAGIAVAIPIVLLVVAVAVPAVVAGIAGKWVAVASATAFGLLLLILLALAFTAIWGTFTSALWTVFFRRLTGLEVLEPAAPVVPTEPRGIEG